MIDSKALRILISLCYGILGGSALSYAQAGGAQSSAGMQSGGAAQTGNSTAGSSSTSQMVMAPQAEDQSYRGSVPQGTASPTPLTLTMTDAINRGLKANLG